jgi:hypothetical protein
MEHAMERKEKREERRREARLGESSYLLSTPGAPPVCPVLNKVLNLRL